MAAVSLAIYTFLAISRLPELFSFIGTLRPILLMALVTMALAWALPRRRLQAVLAAPELLAALGILVLAAASVPTSYWPGASFRFAVFSFPRVLLFFFLLMYCVRTFAELRYTVLAFAGAGAALEIGVLLFNVKERVRITGTYDPNDLAFVMVCVIPVATMLLMVERGLVRYAMIPVILLGLVTIIMTKSRGGFITLLVVGAIILVKLPSRTLPLRIGLVIGAIVVFSVFAPQSYWDRITTIWEDSDEESAAMIQGSEPRTLEYNKQGFSIRWQIWITGLRLMLEHPVLGVGVNAFAMAEQGQTFGRGQSPGGGQRGWKAAHNSFTQVGAELGVLGLVLFVYLLYRSVRNYRFVIRLARSVPQLRYHLWAAHGLDTAMYGYIVAGAALNHGYSTILYYLVAMSVVMKWVTLRDRARLADDESLRPAAGRSMPWWKVPR